MSRQIMSTQSAIGSYRKKQMNNSIDFNVSSIESNERFSIFTALCCMPHTAENSAIFSEIGSYTIPDDTLSDLFNPIKCSPYSLLANL
jgi:hypothetical protein